MRLGAHVSIAGHIYESVDRALDLGINTFQIFPRNPRQVKPKKEDILDDIEEFKRRRSKADISPVVVHMPYIVNLATPKEHLFQLSLESYINDINNSAKLGAEYLVTHLGSFVGSTEVEGLKRFSRGIAIILEKTPKTVSILLENTAGSGSQLGAKIEHLEYVIKNNKSSKRLGMCMDTAHTFAAGFDISKKKGLDQFLSKVDESIGIERIKVVHLNDSKTELGTHLDRHENIGQGYIGKAGFRLILNNKYLKDLAFILETPGRDDLDNLKIVRKLRK